ncbi:MAG: sigma-70 family RNA polymerase sigma factor [Candidatus Eisenbacteria bacterium]
METLNETTLIEGAKNGDRASQEAIVRLYERRVYGLILRLVGNREDARDILQETMVKALTSINRYDGSYPFLSWLFKIGANKSIDFLRRRKIELKMFAYEDEATRIEDLPDGGAPGAGGLDDRIDWAIVERSMENLEPRYRAVLFLRYRDDLSYQEIARVLSIPMGTVKVLLHRGRLELKKQVMKELGTMPDTQEPRR